MTRFTFVQFELAGALGMDDGRYPARPPGSGAKAPAEAVLVTRTAGAPAARKRRQRKPRRADPEAAPSVPVTELTVISTEPLEGDPQEWLEELRRDEQRRDAVVDRGLEYARRAVAARRVAAAEPGIADPTLESALAVRVGYGQGDGLVDGGYEDALDLPREDRRQGRTAALRPQERTAALLGGRERALVCEELIIRAHSDVDAGRLREATLQVRVGLEALLAERGRLEGPGQDEDLAFLDGRRQATGTAANEALDGELSADRAAEVAETLAVCERVLRRRAARG